MIAKIRRGAYFRGLQLYLLSELKGVAPEDVEARCLVSVDTAAREMQLAASRSKRTQRAVYHVILAWAEEERPSRDQQFAIGHELLERIGLADHQALLVRHPELEAGTGHHHELHLMVNRVGPGGRAAAMRNDYALVERTVADIAAAHAMRVVPGRYNGQAGFVQGSSEQARSVASATGRLSPAMALRANPSAMAELTLARAQGWTALIEAFARHRLVLEESNRETRAGQSAGLVLVDIHNAERREKISALDTPDLKWGLPTLEREIGEFPKELASTIGSMAAEAHVDGGAQPSPPRLEEGRDTFATARSQALAERRRVSEAHAEEKRRLRQEQGQGRERLVNLAAERRRQVRAFFGRSSELGRALNHVLDVGSDERLAKRKVADGQELQSLMERHRRELSLVSVPTWADWRRAHGRHEPEPPVAPPHQEQRPASSPGPNIVECDETVRPSHRAAAALAIDAAEHEARADRLRRNRERRAALRRGDLDARVEALLDQACTAVAAEIVRGLSPRHGTRLTVLVIAALALGGGIGPTLLAAAAVALLRRGEIVAERTRMRLDVDEAKAARTGWSFAAVPASARARYAALSRSDLIAPAGPDAGPLIASLGREEAARFVAWWAYASPKQRGVVQGWGRPPRKRPAPARPRPARQRTRQALER